MRILGTSPRTSAAGWASGLAGAALAIVALVAAVRAASRGEAPLSEEVLTEGLIAIGLLGAWIQGLLSRDNGVSSEEARDL